MAGPPSIPVTDQEAMAAAEQERIRRLAPRPGRLAPAVWPALQQQAVTWVTGSPGWLVPERLRRWSETVLEFLERLERDESALASQLGLAPQPITQLQTGCSDPHDGNRTVFRFRTGSGPSAWYKPRDGHLEAACYRLVARLASPDLAAPARTIPAPDCFWVEHIDQPDPAAARDSERLSRSAGALLALLDLLQAADVHPANLAARGHRLIPIDLETACHPTLPWENPATRDPADPASVLRVGIISGPGWPAVLHAQPLGDGFSDLYRRLDGDAVDRFLREVESRPGRVLLRATERYRTAWRDSGSAGLAEEAARRAALDRALAIGPGGIRSAVPAEVRALEAGALAQFDIPRFTARPGELAVTCSSTGQTVGPVCADSGLSRVAQRRRVHGTADLADRLAVLTTGLALEQARASLPPPGGTPA